MSLGILDNAFHGGGGGGRGARGGGGAEACSAGVLGFFEVCDFCDLQGVDQLASTAASLRSDQRWSGKCDANTASVVGCDDIIRFCGVALCR